MSIHCEIESLKHFTLHYSLLRDVRIDCILHTLNTINDINQMIIIIIHILDYPVYTLIIAIYEEISKCD